MVCHMGSIPLHNIHALKIFNSRKTFAYYTYAIDCKYFVSNKI